jgi:DNA modification methylase
MKNLSITTGQQIQVVKIENLKEVENLKNFYTKSSDEDIQQLVNSIKNEGQKYPIILSKDLSIIDGYNRVYSLKVLGIEVVNAIFVDDEPTIDTRITFNLYRVKNSMDLTNEVISVFENTSKKQGKRNDGEPYDRYKVISEKLNYCWKSPKSIRKLESVINNDFDNKLLIEGIVTKGWTLDDCDEYTTNLKKVDIDNQYGFTQKLEKGELTIKEVNKFIREKDFLTNSYESTFIIPNKSTSLNINCLDIKNREEYKGKVSTIVTSIPYFDIRFYENGDGDNQLGHEKTPEEYAKNVAKIFNELTYTLNETSNVFINVGESYVDGCAMNIPNLVKFEILKQTNLKSKCELIWSKPNPKPQGEKVLRPINDVEYILWFVVDPKKAKYNMITYFDDKKEIQATTGAKDVDNKGTVLKKTKSLSKPYDKIYTHIAAQDVLHMIKCQAGKNSSVYKAYSEGHPAVMAELLPVLPIMMTTDEGDIVYDPMAGSNVVGRMSMLLNRVALSTELSSHYHKIGCRVMENTLEEINLDDLKVITDKFIVEPSTLSLAA